MRPNSQPRTMSQEFYVGLFLSYYRDATQEHRLETLAQWRISAQASGEYCGAYREAVKRIDAES